MKNKALICGYFEPLHMMHLSLIRAVEQLGYELVFGLFTKKDDIINAETRRAWLERFGRVVLIEYAENPYEEINPLLLPENIALVAGSNPELLKIARRLDTPHFLWDPEREAWNLEAADVLAEPARHWRDMPDFVRANIQRRMTFVGPESVGKSWFAREMAQKYGGPHIPEYGRPHEKYRAAKDYTGTELALLARRHAASRFALSQLAGPVVFEDTDELMTAVWSEMLLERETEEVERLIELPSLYVLYHWDTPWEEDKIRYFARADLRRSFFDRIEAKLRKHGANYVTIGGTWAEREAATIKEVEAQIEQVRFIHKPQD